MDFVNLGSMARELLVTQESEEIKKYVLYLFTNKDSPEINHNHESSKFTKFPAKSKY